MNEDDFAGVLQSQKEVFDSGNQLLKLYDADNHKIAQEVDVDEDAQGNIDAVNVILNSPVVQAGGSIGEVFGSAIGRALAAATTRSRSSRPAPWSAPSARRSERTSPRAISISNACRSISRRPSAVSASGRRRGAGSIASFLTAELGTALHLNGLARSCSTRLSAAITGSVLNQMVTSSVEHLRRRDWRHQLDPAFDQAEVGIAIALGSILAHELVTAQPGPAPKAARSSARSAARSAWRSPSAGRSASSSSAVLPGIGSLIGTILGTIIGDIIGDRLRRSRRQSSILSANYSYSATGTTARRSATTPSARDGRPWQAAWSAAIFPPSTARRSIRPSSSASDIPAHGEQPVLLVETISG